MCFCVCVCMCDFAQIESLSQIFALAGAKIAHKIWKSQTKKKREKTKKKKKRMKNNEKTNNIYSQISIECDLLPALNWMVC